MTFAIEAYHTESRQTIPSRSSLPKPDSAAEEGHVSTSPIEFFSTNNKGAMWTYNSRRGMYPGYTHILAGKFGAGGECDFFGYDPVAGQGDIWTTNDKGALVWVNSYPSLPKGCTQVVAANLLGDDCRDLLFYQPEKAQIEIYQVNMPGRLTPAIVSSGIRSTWTSIVMGSFGSRPYQHLFFYDAAAGLGEFYASAPAANGQLQLVGQNSSLRKGCTQVVSGNYENKEHA